MIYIPKLSGDAFCEDSPCVTAISCIFKGESEFEVSQQELSCSLFFLQEPWRWFQGSSFCACSTLRSLSFMDPGRYLGEVTVQCRLKLQPQTIKVVRVSYSYILTFMFLFSFCSVVEVFRYLSKSIDNATAKHSITCLKVWYIKI